MAYYSTLDSHHGRPAKDARMVIGAVIIKHKLCLRDEETIEQVRENPYLHICNTSCFVGLKKFQTDAIFVSLLFVEIRNRMGADVFDAFQQGINDAVELIKQSQTNKVETELTQQQPGQEVLDEVSNETSDEIVDKASDEVLNVAPDKESNEEESTYSLKENLPKEDIYVDKRRKTQAKGLYCDYHYRNRSIP